MSRKNIKALVSYKNAANRLDVSRSTIERMVKRGIFNPVDLNANFGRKPMWRIPESELEALMNESV